jgi:hypothetical protein
MYESANDAMIRWLAKQSPEARHFTALHLNWDYALPCVAWLVSREDCDLATGVAVFWLGNPEEFLKYPSLERVKKERGDSDTFELLDRIVKWEADGLYTRRQISRNPEEFGRPDLYDREAAKYRLEDLPWDLPSVFGRVS